MWPALHSNRRSQTVHIVEITTMVWLLGNDSCVYVNLKINKLEYSKRQKLFRYMEMPVHIFYACGLCMKEISAGHEELALRVYSCPIKFSYECYEMYSIKR